LVLHKDLDNCSTSDNPEFRQAHEHGERYELIERRGNSRLCGKSLWDERLTLSHYVYYSRKINEL